MTMGFSEPNFEQIARDSDSRMQETVAAAIIRQDKFNHKTAKLLLQRWVSEIEPVLHYRYARIIGVGTADHIVIRTEDVYR